MEQEKIGMQMMCYMKRLWKFVYMDIRWGWLIVFSPSILVLYTAMSVLMVVEFVLLDILWLALSCLEDRMEGKKGTLARNIWYLNH